MYLFIGWGSVYRLSICKQETVTSKYLSASNIDNVYATRVFDDGDMLINFFSVGLDCGVGHAEELEIEKENTQERQILRGDLK